MEKCPVCSRIYQDNALAFCVDDGARLVPVTASDRPTAPFRNAPPTSPVQPAKKNNLLIFSGIGAAVAALFVGVIFVIFLAVKLNSSSGANANQAANVQTSTEKYTPELKMAIGRANDALALAFSNYDMAQVRQYFTGEALKSTVAQIELLQKSNMYRTSKLENQQFEYIKVNDAGTEAEIRVTDTRSSVFKEKKSGNCIAEVKSKKTPQVLFLKKTTAGWVIDSIVYDVIPDSTPLPCSTN